MRWDGSARAGTRLGRARVQIEKRFCFESEPRSTHLEETSTFTGLVSDARCSLATCHKSQHLIAMFQYKKKDMTCCSALAHTRYGTVPWPEDTRSTRIRQEAQCLHGPVISFVGQETIATITVFCSIHEARGSVTRCHVALGFVFVWAHLRGHRSGEEIAAARMQTHKRRITRDHYAEARTLACILNRGGGRAGARARSHVFRSLGMHASTVLISFSKSMFSSLSASSRTCHVAQGPAA